MENAGFCFMQLEDDKPRLGLLHFCTVASSVRVDVRVARLATSQLCAVRLLLKVLSMRRINRRGLGLPVFLKALEVQFPREVHHTGRLLDSMV